MTRRNVKRSLQRDGGNEAIQIKWEGVKGSTGGGKINIKSKS